MRGEWQAAAASGWHPAAGACIRRSGGFADFLQLTARRACDCGRGRALPRCRKNLCPAFAGQRFFNLSEANGISRFGSREMHRRARIRRQGRTRFPAALTGTGRCHRPRRAAARCHRFPPEAIMACRKALRSFSGAEAAVGEENQAGCCFSPQKPCLLLSAAGVAG